MNLLSKIIVSTVIGTCTLVLSVRAQSSLLPSEISEQDTINYKDKQGRKQGVWIRYSDRDSSTYDIEFFKDGWLLERKDYYKGVFTKHTKLNATRDTVVAIEVDASGNRQVKEIFHIYDTLQRPFDGVWEDFYRKYLLSMEGYKNGTIADKKWMLKPVSKEESMNGKHTYREVLYHYENGKFKSGVVTYYDGNLNKKKVKNIKKPLPNYTP